MKRAFLDALFPLFCFGCGREGTRACSDCLSGLRVRQYDGCPVCCRPSPGGRTHVDCLGAAALDGVVSPFPYADPLVKGLIKDYKYHGSDEVEVILRNLAAMAVGRFRTQFPQGAVVVPMPLHPARLRWRGFNQAERIGQTVAEVLGAPLVTPLKRIRRTEEQARLDPAERAENCARAFLSDPFAGDVILVDDVYTSGATMAAAAAAMKKAGARTVVGFALAHG